MTHLSRYIRKARNAAWEARLNIRTRGRLKHDLDPDAHSCVSCAYTVIRRILDRLEMTKRDILVDIGCGKGRVVCCAARHRIRKAVGVEIHPALCSIARKNAGRLRGAKAPIEFIEAPAQAQEVDYSEGTLFFIFHSFGPKTMARVLERIRDTLNDNPRDIKLVYVNDRTELPVLQESGWLELVDRWLPDQWSQLENPVSFWRSIKTE